MSANLASSGEFETVKFKIRAQRKFTWWLNPRMHACSKEKEDVLEKLEEEKIQKLEEEKTNNSYKMTEA